MCGWFRPNNQWILSCVSRLFPGPPPSSQTHTFPLSCSFCNKCFGTVKTQPGSSFDHLFKDLFWVTITCQALTYSGKCLGSPRHCAGEHMNYGFIYDLAAYELSKWKQWVRKQRGKVHLCTMRETELGMIHRGLGTSLLASQRHTGECSEKSNKNDKWAERLIYEDLHNKICILGSTKTSEEMWSLSTTLWRLWIPQRCLVWYLKWWQGIRGWQIDLWSEE